MEKTNKNTKDNVQEKVENKVETKSNLSRKPRKSTKSKECDVLVYNENDNTAIISFDGYGFTIHNVTNNPGDKIVVKYTGSIDSSNFKIIE